MDETPRKKFFTNAFSSRKELWPEMMRKKMEANEAPSIPLAGPSSVNDEIRTTVDVTKKEAALPELPVKCEPDVVEPASITDVDKGPAAETQKKKDVRRDARMKNVVIAVAFFLIWGGLIFAWTAKVDALVSSQLQGIVPPEKVLSIAFIPEAVLGGEEPVVTPGGTATSTIAVVGGEKPAPEGGGEETSAPAGEEEPAIKRTTATIAPDAGSYEFEIFYNEASSEYRVKVFKRGNKVPVQILKMNIYGEEEGGKIRVTDLNFDGYKDVLGLSSIDEYKNRVYSYAFFDPQKGTFSCNRVTSSCEFINPSVFADLQEVTEDVSCGDEGYCKNVRTYRLYKGGLMLARIEEYERESETLYCLRVTDISLDTKKKTISRECTNIGS